jgi:tRNA pseudouridine65 synthase
MNDVDETDSLDPMQPVPILYEDESLVAVDKPSGLFVHRSESDRSATEFVLQNVRDQLGHFVYPVHRLDRPTSGVLLLAKNPDAAALLANMFSNRQIHKSYLALVRGHTEDSGTIERPLVSSKGIGKPIDHPQSTPQDAETSYVTQDRFEVPFSTGEHSTTRCALVEATPKTGRYHQIRRHFSGISHPIIGDSEHGDTRFNRRFSERLEVTRLMLAAVRVEFIHPVTSVQTIIECPPAESFAVVVERLRRCRM